MTEELKRPEDSEEQAEKLEEKQGPTSEQVEVPPTEEEETPSEPTPEEAEKERIQKLIDAAEARVQKAKDKEIADLRREHGKRFREEKARQEAARLDQLEESEKQRFGETEPELLAELQQLRRRVYSTATTAGETMQLGYAYKYGKEYGVDPEALMDSASPEEMEAKAKELAQTVEKDEVKKQKDRIKQLEEELAEAKKAPQKIDSSAPSGAGVNWRELTPQQKLVKGLEQPFKK